MKEITIIGAGLAGSLAALFLARRNYKVNIIESRQDLRLSNIESGRSINLALSCRGITALKKAGLYEEAKPILVPMRARAIHESDGAIHYQSFGRNRDEYINAVMRSDLNELILNEIEQFENIDICFNSDLQEIDFTNRVLVLKQPNGQTLTTPFKHLIGADGANSKVREEMSRHQLLNYRRDYLPCGYKELSISERHGALLKREHLHLWPRDSFMLLGNPNTDDSLTGSLFIAHEGHNSLEQLTSEKDVNDFFKNNFPDVTSYIPNLVEEFFNHPTGNMSTINCSNWHHQDRCLLIGDAAHGIIPFFGQGMNCAFEDCRVLDELIEEYNGDWIKIMPSFYKRRKKNTEAVAEMSMDNYREIQHEIRDPKFNLKKQVEKEMMVRYPKQYVTKHVLVMFSNVPYQKAYEIGEIQTDFIDQICQNAHRLEDIDWADVDKLIFEYDKKMADYNLGDG